MEGERELVVPGWLEGTWSLYLGGGDMVTLLQFVFLDGGGVVNSGQRCWASDTGETPPSLTSVESPDASWSWGSGSEIHLVGIAALILAGFNLGEGDYLSVRPNPDDCRRLDARVVSEAWDEFGLGTLEYADRCFNSEQSCSPGQIQECSETPDGCPGD